VAATCVVPFIGEFWIKQRLDYLKRRKTDLGPP